MPSRRLVETWTAVYVLKTEDKVISLSIFLTDNAMPFAADQVPLFLAVLMKARFPPPPWLAARAILAIGMAIAQLEAGAGPATV